MRTKKNFFLAALVTIDDRWNLYEQTHSTDNMHVERGNQREMEMEDLLSWFYHLQFVPTNEGRNTTIVQQQ